MAAASRTSPATSRSACSGSRSCTRTTPSAPSAPRTSCTRSSPGSSSASSAARCSSAAAPGGRAARCSRAPPRCRPAPRRARPRSASACRRCCTTPSGRGAARSWTARARWPRCRPRSPQARDERACRVMSVIGPAGIGKSRLADELAASLDATVVSGGCPSYGEGVTYRPLAEIVGRLGGREGVEALLGDGAAAQKVLTAAGLSEGQAQAEETFWAVRRLLEAAAAERPLVVVLEDLHWAEPTLLDLVEYLAVFSSGHPILLVCAARPELLETRPSWGSAGPRGDRARPAARGSRPHARRRRAASSRPARPSGSSRRRRATRSSSSSSSPSAPPPASCRRASRPCWRRGSPASSPASARCSRTPRCRDAASTRTRSSCPRRPPRGSSRSRSGG